MSYDLVVYAPRAHDAAGLRELVAGSPGLAAGGEAADGLTVVRQPGGGYCFTVDGPWPMEDEDVPPELAEAAANATNQYGILVEGTAPESIPLAIGFARRLAESLDGVAYDQQTDEVWPVGVARVVVPPPVDRISVVEMHWYAKPTPGGDLGADYLALCRRLLPEALPRRYGEFEPLGHKLETGDEAFAAAWRDATSILFFTAHPPFLDGFLDGGAERSPTRVWEMSLDVQAEPLRDARLRAALRALFVALAERVGAYYASAELTRGHRWNGRTVSSDFGTTESAISPTFGRRWYGLPPYPVSWGWYGGPYRDLVASRLSGGEVTEAGGGILHTLGDLPADRDALTGLVTRRHGLRKRTEWAPPELLSTVEPNDGRIQPTPLLHAERMPDELRSTTR